jgi:putative endonuclease
MKLYYVYILSSINRVLYVGLTSNFEQRLWSHRTKEYSRSFTAQYNVTRLVYYEEYTRVSDAILREKQIKSWRRAKKLALIQTLNPDWDDLAPALYPESDSTSPASG